MLTTVFKYPLEITNRQIIKMPLNSKILSIQTQKGKLQLWALVHLDNEMVEREILIYGTGHKQEDIHENTYIGTVLMYQNQLVWHIFEGRKL